MEIHVADRTGFFYTRPFAVLRFTGETCPLAPMFVLLLIGTQTFPAEFFLSQEPSHVVDCVKMIVNVIKKKHWLAVVLQFGGVHDPIARLGGENYDFGL